MPRFYYIVMNNKARAARTKQDSNEFQQLGQQLGQSKISTHLSEVGFTLYFTLMFWYYYSFNQDNISVLTVGYFYILGHSETRSYTADRFGG